MTDNKAAPKLFISYSWSNEAHVEWVVQLAESLVESGIDVQLDKWDLREGHDSIAFMERMVTDSDIKKVVMICDETYARKADGRDGGVGTETQIISKGVYEKTTQEKFVAVLATRDEQGKPYLPTYYTSRIFIDLSDESRYVSEFEKLVRWIFDKPVYVKPAIGARPAFIEEADAISLGTSTIYRRCIDALKHGRPFSAGALEEYFGIYSTNLARFEINLKDGSEPDDLVVESIQQFEPYRNEVVSLFQTIAQYAPTAENAERVHRFLERIFAYTRPKVGAFHQNDWQFQNFKFIVHEIFLYALAALLRHERFELANILLEQPYYLREDESRAASSSTSYVAFNQSVGALEHRKRRLESKRFSLHADLLEQRVVPGFEMRHLMQADFVAFMRQEFLGTSGFYNSWWPESLLYADRTGAFEIFARASSRAYFDRVKVVLGVTRKEDIDSLLAAYKAGRDSLPRFGYIRINPAAMLAADELCTQP